MNKTQNSKQFHVFLIGLFILLSAVFGHAQSENKDLPSTTTWHGFQIGITTPDEVLKTLGKPKKDKAEVSQQTLAVGWTQLDARRQTRQITYKKLGSFDSVEFTFVENKLAEMNLLFKQNKMQGIFKSESSLFPAAKIPELFHIDFLLFRGIPKNSKITDYENQKETTVPKVYPQYYSMLGINKDSVIVVSVENSSLKSSFKGIFNKPTVELFPGFAQRIQIFSRP